MIAGSQLAMQMTRKPFSTIIFGRLTTPGAMIGLFLLVMSSCVLGLIIWKASEARRTTLQRAEAEIQNLTHSLAQHAQGTFKAVDVATAGMVDLLRFQQPLAERFNTFLSSTVRSLPQLAEIGVLDANGDYIYASTAEMPTYNNSDRSYFEFHRDNGDQAMKISGPVFSRLLKKQVIVLTKRVTRQDGSFGGVIVAAIDCNFFSAFYRAFNLGARGGIGLVGSGGVVLAHSDSKVTGQDISRLELFQSRLGKASTGYYKVVSPFDGLIKYFGYEQIQGYKTLSTVALPEDELLANWRNDLEFDLIVAAAMFCVVCFMMTLLSAQFRHRNKIETSLRHREKRYRLLAENIADIVIQLDRHGNFLYVSHSVELVLGWKPEQLTGTSCFDMVHPGDVESVKLATACLVETNTTQTLRFRTYRSDRSLCWVEIVFRLTMAADNARHVEIVGVLRDIDQRKSMEDELTAANARLAEMARTDGLTGLANRRSLDGFLNREFEANGQISVLMFDIDHFKGFNDRLGHQAGDECLKRVAEVIASATHSKAFLSARYGGEEFVVVLPGIAEQHAFIIAESVRLKVKALGIVNPAASRGHVSVSVGVASKTPKMHSDRDLIAEADMALYQAKRAGRNRSVTATTLVRDFGETSLVPSQPHDKIETSI